MSFRVSSPSKTKFIPASLRLTGLLLVGLGFLSACDLSYPTSTWTDPVYDHVALSGGYELVGPHYGAACAECHATGNFEVMYEPTSNQDCQACHTADFEIQHGSLGYPTTCLTCHNGSVWERSEFGHGKASGGFNLSGPHTTLNCTKCHFPDTFAPRFNPASPGDCGACHG